ncbi:endolytic transglycosylase MltG [Microbacterium immunditiarum]|uniref:Endolytic murein transglycosylase n=1 Tax=Microbacterium immunditiarum TaxID=337480 RepID=A0A7Y9GPR0_9MICO|nr:endolytic transglycosylase MltG [Microbacterium immunditiarum]NYE20403.1 UPF0755 protein [Microbacterium immunditiarum]
MPQSPSPYDDPFAGLFGKLPDPRAHLARSASEGSGHSGDGVSGGAPATGGVPPQTGAVPTYTGAVPTQTGSVPLSRRAAREAAAREAAARDAAPREAAAQPETVALPTPPQASPHTPQPATTAFETPVAASAPPGSIPAGPNSPTAGESDAYDLDDDPARSWQLSGEVAAQPALPYSRTGSIPIISESEARAAAKRAGAGDAGGGLEALFSGDVSTTDIGSPPPPKDKRKRRIGGWIALGVIVALLGGIALGGWWVWNTYESQIRAVLGWEEPKDFEAGMANGEALVTIESGDTGQSISPKLYEAGVTKTPEAFYAYLIETQQNPPFQPGVFRLQKQMTSEAALAMILDPASKLENSALIPEGKTVEQTTEILADSLQIPIEDFQAAIADPAAYGVAADSLEGWLFPAMYTFDPGVTANDVIARMVARTIQSLDEAGVPIEDRQRILTIASIIQREARYEADMQKVSRVIQNRLDPNNQETFGLLQMDSTAQYGFGEMHDGTVSSSEEALTDPNPWNTYVNPGLPIGPISNPGDVAISSAMHPADGDWLYFVTVNLDTGETVFTSNINDHNRAVDQWRGWCREHPDSGC